MPSFGFAVETLWAPAMAFIETSILLTPSLATAAGAQQCRIMVTDNDRFVNPRFGSAIALERTPGAILRLRVKEAAARWAARAQDTSSRALDVVLSIVPEACGTRLLIGSGFSWDEGINAAPLERAIDFSVGIARVGGDLDVDALAASFVGPVRDRDFQNDTDLVVDSRVLL